MSESACPNQNIRRRMSESNFDRFWSRFESDGSADGFGRTGRPPGPPRRPLDGTATGSAGTATGTGGSTREPLLPGTSRRETRRARAGATVEDSGDSFEPLEKPFSSESLLGNEH